MSQKNGHALESVTLTAMLRRWTSSLLLIAVTAASALSAMILQNLTIRQENALSSTIENTTISCTVTNAKGTDSGNLQMLSALLHAALMTGIFLLGSAAAALRITSINVMNLMKVED